MATTELPRRTLPTKRHLSPMVPTETPGTPPSPSVKAPQRVQPLSTEDIPENHQTIDQRLRSQLEPKQLEPATVTEQPMAHCNRYRTTKQTLRVQLVLAAQRKYPEKVHNLWCTPRPEEHISMTVLDNKTVESL